MDINDIFNEKVTNTTLNPSKNKRKMGAAPSLRELKSGGYGFAEDASESNKRARPSDADDDAETQDSDSDGEGGRFFSDGLTTHEKGVMKWVDHMEEVDGTLDHISVQRMVLRLERAVSRNTQDRVKHAEEPEHFAESEAELDEAIQRLLMLANDVQCLRTLEELGALPTLVGLMAHENADITLDVIQLVVELTAEDAWSQEGESLEERRAVVGFVASLADNEFFEMLGQNLRRLNEAAGSLEGEADRQGVFQTLTLVENLVSLDMQLAERAVRAAGLLEWLQSRITTARAASDEEGTAVDSNQQYAAEIVSILLQSLPRLRNEVAESTGFVDVLLNCLAKYRKRTPTDGIETEYLENIVDSLCVLVAEPRGKTVFVDLEGVELLVVLQKQQQHVGRLLSLKILDYALSPPPPPPSQETQTTADGRNSPHPTGASSASKTEREIAKRYIDAMGLKYLLSILMHHGKGSAQKLFKKHPETDERAINCISWLLRLTDHETPAHWRVLAKFTPSTADAASWKPHIDRVVELNIAFAERVREAEERFDRDAHESDGEEDSAEERYLSRLEAGLFSLQMTDIVLAFIAADDQVRERIEKQLRRKGRSLAAVRDELGEHIAAKSVKSLTAAETLNRGDRSEDQAVSEMQLSEMVPLL